MLTLDQSAFRHPVMAQDPTPAAPPRRNRASRWVGGKRRQLVPGAMVDAALPSPSQRPREGSGSAAWEWRSHWWRPWRRDDDEAWWTKSTAAPTAGGEEMNGVSSSPAGPSEPAQDPATTTTPPSTSMPTTMSEGTAAAGATSPTPRITRTDDATATCPSATRSPTDPWSSGDPWSRTWASSQPTTRDSAVPGIGSSSSAVAWTWQDWQWQPGWSSGGWQRSDWWHRPHDSNPVYKGDFSDPPGWPGWAMRRYWVQSIQRWNKTTDLPVHKRADKVLRSLGWELQSEFEHLPESVLQSSAYLDVIVEIMNNKAGVREDDERRRAYRSAITDLQRHRDESLAQFAVRRMRDFAHASQYGVIIPDPFKATLLREGAGLNDQNQQNLSTLLQGQDECPQAVARALSRLDVRSDRMTGFAAGENAPEEDTGSYLGHIPEDEESLDEDDIAHELEALDLTEDQVLEVYAVLDAKRQRPRSWKENKEFKAELKKDRGAFVKGGPVGAGGRERRGELHRSGRTKMNKEQLKKISRCRICMKKGHWAEDCDANKNKKPVVAFAYSSSLQGGASAFSFITFQALYEAVREVQFKEDKSLPSFLTLPSGEAILDTGATQDLIGEVALQSIGIHLKSLGLKHIAVDAPTSVPMGIGGAAEVTGVVLLPISPGGCPGVLEVTVLKGGIPPLLSIGFMDFLGTSIDLKKNEVHFSLLDVSLPLKRLASGHRTLNLFDWEKNRSFPVPSELVKKYQLSEGDFNLGSSSAYTKEAVHSVSRELQLGSQESSDELNRKLEEQRLSQSLETSAVPVLQQSHLPSCELFTPMSSACTSCSTSCTTPRTMISGHVLAVCPVLHDPVADCACGPPQLSGSTSPMGNRSPREAKFDATSLPTHDGLSPEPGRCCSLGRALGGSDGPCDGSVGGQPQQLQEADSGGADRQEHGQQSEEVHRGRVSGAWPMPLRSHHGPTSTPHGRCACSAMPG